MNDLIMQILKWYDYVVVVEVIPHAIGYCSEIIPVFDLQNHCGA